MAAAFRHSAVFLPTNLFIIDHRKHLCFRRVTLISRPFLSRFPLKRLWFVAGTGIIGQLKTWQDHHIFCLNQFVKLWKITSVSSETTSASSALELYEEKNLQIIFFR